VYEYPTQMHLREHSSEGSSNTRWEWVYKYPTPHKEWSWPKYRREWVYEYPTQIQSRSDGGLKLQERVGVWISNSSSMINHSQNKEVRGFMDTHLNIGLALCTTSSLKMNRRPRRESNRSHLPPLMLNMGHLKIEPPQNTIVPIPTWFHNRVKGSSR
jgi:hypothetical protein